MYCNNKRISLVSRLTTVFLALAVFSSNADILRNEADIRQHIHTMPNSSSLDFQSFLSSLVDESRNDMILRAEKALEEGLKDIYQGFNVSDTCLNHTEMILQGLVERQDWALRMIDAMGKPSSGLMNYQLNWLGSFDECRAIQATVNVSGKTVSPFSGRYCTASIGQQQQSVMPMVVKIGLCVPNSCSDNETAALTYTLLSLFPMNISAMPKPTVKCQLETLELDTKAIMVIVVMSLFGLVMTAATAYDVIVVRWMNGNTKEISKYEVMKDDHERSEKVTPFGGETNYGTTASLKAAEANGDVTNGNVVQSCGISKADLVKVDVEHTETMNVYQPGKLGQVLLSFSIYTNASKILNTNQPSGTLTAINGIRFVSMTWVIMGHSFGGSTVVAENAATFIPKMFKRFTFQAISNATVSVDTFFTLSGLLVAYLCLKEMKKRDGAKKFKWGMFYFHRFWRLTPPYMLFLMFYVCLEKYWSDGPLWPQQGTEINDCKDSWWRNMLYINNLIKPMEQCMGWGWYLANDMQFYVLSPLMLIPLYYSTVLGSLSCMTFLLVSVISTGIISKANGFSASLISLDQTKTAEYYEKIYVAPWCRIGPYAVGFFAGYLLYKTECKIRMPKIVVLIGWATATAIALLVLYGLYDPDSKTGFADLSTNMAAFYNATNRSAWGLAVCWVIVACATGNGGFVNTLLSWKALIPLSRLTYCAYLVHLVVIDVYANSKRSLIYFTDLEQIYYFLGHLCLSYATAFIVSLTFEAPMMGLEKALLGRGKNS